MPLLSAASSETAMNTMVAREQSPKRTDSRPAIDPHSRCQREDKACWTASTLLKDVAPPALRVDQLHPERVVDLRTQPTHQHFDDVGVGIEINAPYHVRDEGAR